MDESDSITDDDIAPDTRTIGYYYDAFPISIRSIADRSVDREIATDYERIEYRILYNRTRVVDISLDIEYPIHYRTCCDTSGEERCILEHGTTSCIGDRTLLRDYPSVIEVELSDIGACGIADDTDSLHTIARDLDRIIEEVEWICSEAIRYHLEHTTSWLCEHSLH
jgi:hypothetical protein